MSKKMTNTGNIQNKYIKNLIEMGLTQEESLVYFTMLNLGKSKILEISRKSGMKRTTIYGVVSNLIKTGIVSIKEEGFKKYFVAENPERLKTIVENKKNKLLEILPDLQNIFDNKENLSFVKNYKGEEALRVVADEFLNKMPSNSSYCVIGNAEKWNIFDESFFKKFTQKRIVKNIKTFVLLESNELAKKHKNLEQNNLEEVKILPAEYKIESNIVITENKIIIQSLSLPIQVSIIESSHLVKTMNSVFKLIWSIL